MAQNVAPQNEVKTEKTHKCSHDGKDHKCSKDAKEKDHKCKNGADHKCSKEAKAKDHKCSHDGKDHKCSKDAKGGDHKCSKDGFSRQQNKTDDGYGCIDHFLIYDPAGKTEVKTFMRDYAWFTVKLTDHYPNYADIVLK